MSRALSPLLVLAVLAGGSAWAAPKKGRPVWPVPNPSFADPNFAPSPTNRQISGVFGPRLKWGGARYDHHEGFDFYAQYDPAFPAGDHPVLCVLPGEVSQVIAPRSPERTETGNKVIVTHDVPWTKFGGTPEWGPVRTAYLHLSSISVQQGQRLKAGAEIGRAGETGYTSTVHLHFNCYRAGGRDVNVNPARLFSPKLFPGNVARLHKKTVEADWILLDRSQGVALVRVLLPYNAYTLDGFVFQVGKDTSRAISFEQVSAEQRRARDTGDADLVPGLRIFPMRYNGGGTIERLNASSIPRGWPVASYPLEGGKGQRLGFDLLATDVPEEAKSFKLHILGVNSKPVTLKAPGFREIK